MNRESAWHRGVRGDDAAPIEAVTMVRAGDERMFVDAVYVVRHTSGAGADERD